MNILKFSYEYPPLGGGGGHVVAGLADELSRMGHCVDLVTMRYGELVPHEKKAQMAITRVRCLRSSPVICHPHEMMSYICSALPTALVMVRKNSYDIIHAHFIFPDGILAWLVSKMTGIPYIITTHGSDVPGYNPDRFIFLHRMLRPLWKSIVRSCSRVVCLSRFLEDLVTDAMPDAKTIIIPNGFQTGRFRSGRKKSNRILVVTRMFKRKGVQHLLKALDGSDISWETHVVGDGPYLNELKQLAESLSARVIFHGYVDNRSAQFTALMETSKIFVFPSESDNFPIVLLEAMDAGMAIITTRDTGCEEVVGNTALLTRPGDVDEIRTALQKYIHDPELCARSGVMARKRLDENFTWSVVARRYVGIYDAVVNGARK